MKIKTELCYSGHDHWSYRLTLPNGKRDSITVKEGETWNRRIANKALDSLETNFGIERHKIKFT